MQNQCRLFLGQIFGRVQKRFYFVMAIGRRQPLSYSSRCGRRSGPAGDPVLELNATKITGGGVKRPKRLELSAGSISMLAIPAVAFGLGCWQTQRLTWKVNLIDRLNRQTLAAPVPFPINDLSKLSELEYRPVTITGEFLHDREFLISPRGRLDTDYRTEEHRRTAGSLISTDNTSHGAHVITPFRIANSDIVILVNRGWVPLNHVKASSRQAGQVKGTVTINAIVRTNDKRPQFVSENNPATDTWYYRDVEAMGKQHSTAPIFVDAMIDSSVEGGPIGGQTHISLRNEHLSYLITWYTLSAITTFMWFMRFYR